MKVGSEMVSDSHTIIQMNDKMTPTRVKQTNI